MTSSTTSNVGGGLRTLALVLACTAVSACSSGDEGGSSSGSHWLACRVNDDCAEHGTDARCGDAGYCIDDTGERIPAPLAAASSGSSGRDEAGSSGASGGGGGSAVSAGTSGSASAGTTGTSGSSSAGSGSAGSDALDGGSYQPCAGKVCGDSCRQCDPADLGCSETEEPKRCDAEGTCTGSPVECASNAPATCDGAVLGGVCSYRGDAPQPECCDGDIHLRCVPVGCSSVQPGTCQGMYEGLRLSAACGAALVNPAECPSSQPSTPDACDTPGTACGYADGCCACAVYASCGPDPVWGCAPKNPGCPDAPTLNAPCASEGLTCFSCEGVVQSFTCEAGAWTYGTSTFGCR